MRKGKWGRAKTYDIALYDANGDFANVTLASGDVQISKDGGAFANTGSLPSQVGTSGVYSLSLTDAEHEARRVVVRWSDQSGTEFVDGGLAIDLDSPSGEVHTRVTAYTDDGAFTVGNIVAGQKLAGHAVLCLNAAGQTDLGVIASNTNGALVLVAPVGITLAVGSYITVLPALADQEFSASVNSIGANALNAAAIAADALAAIKALVVEALDTDTYGEPAAVPAATASISDKISWLSALSRNKITQTSGTQVLRNDADDAAIASSSVSDDGTTFTRGEYS